MPGHLFIVQADLTTLEVDALAIPTDERRVVEPSWLKHAPETLRATVATSFPVEDGDVVRWRDWNDGRAAYLVDVGRAAPEKPEWYAKRAVAYLDGALADARPQLSHLLDESFVGAIDDAENDVGEALLQLERRAGFRAGLATSARLPLGISAAVRRPHGARGD